MKLRHQKILAWPVCLFFLLGIIFTGESTVLCIGDNGEVKFESLCFPDNCEAEKQCADDFDSDFQDQVKVCEYSHCSDFAFNGPTWSRPVQKIDYSKTGQFASGYTSDTNFSQLFD